MTRQELINQIFTKKSYLCVGLDTDPEITPIHLRSHADSIFEFNKAIIDATQDLCVGYKINTAFYEAQGAKGWEALEKTVAYIPDTHFKIADAKRGDIGNTSSQYAKAFFRHMNFDAITVAPYMGKDSVLPFLQYPDKWTILLGLTSNAGAKDFEMLEVKEKIETLDEGIHLAKENTAFLYEKVLQKASAWGTNENLMFVVGATQPAQFSNIRKIVPDYFLLVPGVGAQGGSLKEISERAMNKDCGLLVNASRAIIYASPEQDFAEKAHDVAQQYQIEMEQYLNAFV